jgi:UDP-glucose 4-epimerase
MPIDAGTVLVVGGAGFIGSHMVFVLQQAGYSVVVLDNLSKGHREAVGRTPLIVGDLADRTLLDELFSQYTFQAVMHFASYIEVAESVREPLTYYENNVAGTLTLLSVMLKYNVHELVFSSSAAVYGEPRVTPIPETHPLLPLHPYGRSKQMIEAIIQDVGKSTGLRYAILRYFNAAGAAYQYGLGERHTPESHLIPLLLAVAAGKQSHLMLYGDDYPTPDGTCIRDYVHVLDLCEAHLFALHALSRQDSCIVNLGSGVGMSVHSVLEMARHITGCAIPVHIAPRRPGDPATLVADITLAQQQLGWQPIRSTLDNMIHDAWQYLLQNASLTLS